MIETIALMILFIGLLLADTTVGVIKWGVLLLAVVKLTEK